jgi:16S rRNA (cytosine1407-C5)-methyltransferase
VSQSQKTGKNDLSSALGRYQGILSPERFEHLQTCALQAAPSAVRINLLKCHNPKAFISRLASDYGWDLSPLPFSDCAWQISNATISPGKTIEHQLGYFYIQDAASILPVSLFSTTTKPRLTLDMAASPGGKTTQLIDSVSDEALVVANDSSASRLKALRSVTEIWGGLNATLTNFPGEKWGTWFPDTFDRVLLDAPCSMESLRDSPSHPHRPISRDERLRLAERQLALLTSAVSAAKIGGEVVYSTCSLAPEEDEFVIDAILKRFPGGIEIEQTRSKAYRTQGLTSFEDRELDPTIQGSLRVWPDSFNTNGFFAAKFIKLAPLGLPFEPSPSRPFETTRLSPISTSKQALLSEFLSELYGFSLPNALHAHNLTILERETQLFLVPTLWLETFASLPYYSLGMPLARHTPQGFEANVDFILRFGDQFTKSYFTLHPTQEKAWLEGLELRNLDYPSGFQGKILAIRNQNCLNLGAGKANPGRLRNFLPHRNLNF